MSKTKWAGEILRKGFLENVGEYKDLNLKEKELEK